MRGAHGIGRLTLAQFVTHARKFGPELVAETARNYLTPAEMAVLETEIALVAAADGRPAGTRQRRTDARLRDHVLALRERGLVATAIADALNISDRRVREILSEGRRRENGGRKRLNEADDFAAKPVAHIQSRPKQLSLPGARAA